LTPAFDTRFDTRLTPAFDTRVPSASLHVCSLDGNDLRRTVTEKWDDFEDCLIEQCAQKVKADYLLSRDTAGFARAKTTVLTPDEFFALVQTEHGLTYDLI
jgi:predicted nucleic acid-binding protein